MKEKEIIQLLKEKRVSVTKNRIRIVKCLTDDKLHFHSIADIIDHVGELNVKSIYNNIKILTDAGIVDCYCFNGVSKYALNDNITEHSEIHIISDNSNDADHLSIDPKIFRQLKRAVEKE